MLFDFYTFDCNFQEYEIKNDVANQGTMIQLARSTRAQKTIPTE